MPTLYMLIGVPGSGKSTWRNANPLPNAVVVSTDDYIDFVADRQGITYGEAFKDNIKTATQLADQKAREAFKAGRDVVWDQTNLTRKTRAPKLAMVPDGYEKVAVFFPTPGNEELKRRLASRPGKTIPPHIVLGMISQIQEPTEDEGFDRVIRV